MNNKPYFPTGNQLTDYIALSTNGHFPEEVEDQIALLGGIGGVVVQLAYVVSKESTFSVPDESSKKAAEVMGGMFFGFTPEGFASAKTLNSNRKYPERPTVKAGMPLE